MNADEVPKEWFCPITQELMKDPVIASDGFTYERRAVEKWLEKSNISPMTGAHLDNLNIIPNLALRNTIIDYLDKKEKPLQVESAEVKYEKGDSHIPNFQIEHDVDVRNGEYIVKCSIVPPQGESDVRKPCSIICILDVSESMDTDAVLGGKDVESHGFSRLDLVKHSINTMIEFLGDEDEMAIIPFSNAARVAAPLTKTTKTNKKVIKKLVNEISASGSTNIWDGLKTSLDLLKVYKNRNIGRNVFVVLLTDGEPNLNPPRGIVPTLKKFLDIEKLPTPNIHVFGYGYELDTRLLAEIAEIGYGTYSYIPDCSMVGTVFVNFMASALSSVTNQMKMKVISNPNLQLIETVGMKKSKGEADYHLGVIQYGHKRQFFLKFHEKVLKSEEESLCQICLFFETGFEEKVFPLQLIRKTKNSREMSWSLLRMDYLKLLQNLCLAKKANIKKSYEQVNHFFQQVLKIDEMNENQMTEGILKELKNEESQNEGQVSKAFEKEEWYEKWGKHYIPSLYLAHLMQTCTNFKDPALQLYGGAKFEVNRTNMDTIFIKMPPPVPSAKKVAKFIYKPAPVNMHDYYNQYGGCVHEDCKVVVDGKSKKVKDLRKGDKLVNGFTLRCLVKTDVFNFIEMVCINDGLFITPWHPVKMNGQWVFPTEVKGASRVKLFIESYYNFVVEKEDGSLASSVICQDIECISLGHGLSDSEVVCHEYFGSLIEHDLKKNINWESGLITVRNQIRDPETRRVIQLQFSDEAEQMKESY